jgi:hypothetical protein
VVCGGYGGPRTVSGWAIPVFGMVLEFVHEHVRKKAHVLVVVVPRHVFPLRRSTLFYRHLCLRCLAARAFGGFGLQGDPASVAAREITF